jgi:hypothetical protein
MGGGVTRRALIAGCGKSLSESFDGAQDERRRIDIIDDFPSLLRYSKHSRLFQQPA